MWGQQPRSIRTNNPGAINFGPFAQKYGATGSDGRLAIFPDVETGRNAMSGLLDTYERKHGLNSVAGILGRWAPRGVDNNSTDLYIKTVASKLGVDPNAPLTAQHRPALMDAMAAYEAGTSNIPRSGSSASPVAASAPSFPPSPEQPMAEDGWSLSRALNGSMFQSGLGGFLAAARGGDVNEGMTSGAQRAAAMQRGQMMEEEQARRKRLEAAFGAGNFAGVPPEIANIAKLLGAEQGGNLIAKSLMERMQAEQGLNTQKQLIDYRNQAEANDPYRQAQIDQARAHTKLYEAQANSRESPDQAFRVREAEAQRLGLKPDSPAYQSYVLTGKMPREDQQPLTATDKKAILEADESVMTTQNAISSLQRARQLSKTAYEGATANERAWLMSQFGDNAANDTRELKQTVTEGALQQLKSIFGGMPTEGERKVLLEVQGSAELPASVREKIYDRAIQLAQKRLEFNKQRAEQMRGGTYYKTPQGQQPAQAGPASGGWSIQRVD